MIMTVFFFGSLLSTIFRIYYRDDGVSLKLLNIMAIQPGLSPLPGLFGSLELSSPLGPPRPPRPPIAIEPTGATEATGPTKATGAIKPAGTTEGHQAHRGYRVHQGHRVHRHHRAIKAVGVIVARFPLSKSSLG